jgi:hypothetical protein
MVHMRRAHKRGEMLVLCSFDVLQLVWGDQCDTKEWW